MIMSYTTIHRVTTLVATSCSLNCKLFHAKRHSSDEDMNWKNVVGYWDITSDSNISTMKTIIK